MIYLIKFFQVIAILFLAFFWNKFILKKLQNIISNAFAKDTDDDNSFSIFSTYNEVTIMKYVQYFYWFLAIIVSILLVIQ